MPDFTSIYRIYVFVPKTHFDDYLSKIQDHIPSFNGPYDRVLWWSDGHEQFRPLEGANPVSGEINKTSRTPTIKLEISFPDNEHALKIFLKDVVKANHPWEKPIILVNKYLSY